MTDLVKALRNRATWETATGITEPHEHIDWMAAEEIARLREENARLLAALKDLIEEDEYQTCSGEEEDGIVRAAARAAIREGGTK